jgi:hypothetical protein
VKAQIKKWCKLARGMKAKQHKTRAGCAKETKGLGSKFINIVIVRDIHMI